MGNTVQSDKVLLKNVRLSFPQLFTPRAFQAGQDPRFEASFIFDPANKDHAAQLAEIKAEIVRLAEETFGKGKVPRDLKTCLVDGNTKDYAGYKDMIVLASHNKVRPTVVNRARGPVAEGDPQAPYAGCYVNATINLWVQNNQFGKRVNASLRAIQFVDDGEAFGRGPVDADNEFEALEDGPSSGSAPAGAADFLFS